MSSKPTNSEKFVDQDLAWDMAHAEKPYRELAKKATELGLQNEAEDLVQKAENASASVEDAAQKLGLTILHSEDEEAAQTPVEHLVTANENEAELVEAINQLTAPYGSLFLDKLPPLSQNERNLFGRIKEGKTKTTRWTTTKAVGGFDIDYAFGLHYRQGQSRNQMMGVDIQFWNHHKEPRSRYFAPVELELVMTGSVINKVQFSRAGSLDTEVQDAIFGGSVLSNFSHNNHNFNTLIFDLSGDAPKVFIGHPSRDDKSMEWEHELRYDPIKNVFTRIVRKEGTQYIHDPEPPASYSPEEIMDLLKSTLDLIPTTRV
jgi:hypothetical protein